MIRYAAVRCHWRETEGGQTVEKIDSANPSLVFAPLRVVPRGAYDNVPQTTHSAPRP